MVPPYAALASSPSPVQYFVLEIHNSCHLAILSRTTPNFD